MIRFRLRYDLRCPAWAPGTPQALYAAALEQCAWADRLGFEGVVLSEHHGSPDGYLPSPIPMSGAIAARTKRILIRPNVLLAPLYCMAFIHAQSTSRLASVK